jgi:hypothetical protein
VNTFTEKPSPEDIELAINNLMQKPDLPEIDHYPSIIKAMLIHELYEIARKRNEPSI